jgi:hypothetical protein
MWELGFFSADELGGINDTGNVYEYPLVNVYIAN